MRFLILIVLLVFSFGCNTPKPVSELTAEDVKIEMYKGSCYGQCPIYTIKIYKGGYTTLLATQFGDKQGEYHRILSRKEYKKFVTAFEDANFPEFKESYPSGIVDFPLVTITYRDKKNRYLTQGRDTRPDELMKLQYMLEDLYEKEGWIQDSAPQVMEEYKELRAFDEGSNEIKNKIIVKLKKGVDIDAWLIDMDAFKLKKDRTLSRDLNLHVVTYNTRHTKPSRMLRLIKGQRDVLEAEFDKPIQQRSK